VLLTIGDANPNAATVRVLVDGAAVPADAEGYERLVLLFNGDDEDGVAAARAQWSEVKARGFEATYWQPDDSGRWVKRA
jgi:DNA polymerase-3 subunit chi